MQWLNENKICWCECCRAALPPPPALLPLPPRPFFSCHQGKPTASQRRVLRAGPGALALGRADLSYAGAGSSRAAAGRVAGVVRSRREEGLAHWGHPLTHSHTTHMHTHTCVCAPSPAFPGCLTCCSKSQSCSFP